MSAQEGDPSSRPHDAFQDPDAQQSLSAVLEIVPKGAFVLAGAALLLLFLAWLFVYFCVFLPRGPIS
jgi:hypothetical protein